MVEIVHPHEHNLLHLQRLGISGCQVHHYQKGGIGPEYQKQPAGDPRIKRFMVKLGEEVVGGVFCHGFSDKF